MIAILFYGGVQLENWINFDNLPRRKDGKIDWKHCNHNLVEFCYRDKIDKMYIEKHLNEYKVSVNFHENIFDMNIESIKRCCLGKLYNFAVADNYYYKIGDILNNKLRILDTTRIKYSNNKTSKGYSVECLTCGYIFDISEVNLSRGDGCPLCSNHRIVEGINDLYSVCPDVAKMLKNPEDGLNNTKYSNSLVEFKCPRCGKDIGKSYIHNVTRFGLSCPYCGDGISYPNKLMYNLLSELGERFENEVVFHWCKFPSYYDDSVLSFGRYDFVIEDKKMIIEMDGGFGHGNDPHPFSKYTRDELIYRDKMKDLLAINHGYIIIRIDCDYSSKNRLTYISHNIVNNNILSKMYDFSKIDWNDINAKCV